MAKRKNTTNKKNKKISCAITLEAKRQFDNLRVQKSSTGADLIRYALASVYGLPM